MGKKYKLRRAFYKGIRKAEKALRKRCRENVGTGTNAGAKDYKGYCLSQHDIGDVLDLIQLPKKYK